MAGPHDVDLTAAVIPSTVLVTLTTKDEVYELHLPRTCGAVILSPRADTLVGYTASVSMTDTGHKIVADGVQQWPVFCASGSAEGGRICLQGSASPTKVAVSLIPRNGIFAE